MATREIGQGFRPARPLTFAREVRIPVVIEEGEDSVPTVSQRSSGSDVPDRLVAGGDWARQAVMPFRKSQYVRGRAVIERAVSNPPRAGPPLLRWRQLEFGVFGIGRVRRIAPAGA